MLTSILHSFLNIFAGGRSAIKVALFGIYTLIIVSLYFLSRRHNVKILKWKWLGLTTLLMYFYGLSLHIFYTFSHKLSLMDFFVTGNNGEISSSVIWHTHIAKGVFGEVFHLLGKNQFQTMDAGGAYIGLVPGWIFLLGFLIFLVLTIQVFFYFPTFNKLTCVGTSKRRLVFLIFGYSVISFSIIKTSIDGGMFDPAFAINLVFIILFVMRLRGKSLLSYYYLLFFAAIALIAASLYINSFKFGNGLVFAQIATMIILYSTLLYGGEEKIRFQFFIPLLLLFMSSWWVSSDRDRNIYNYSSTLLTNKQDIFFYNENKKEVETLKILTPQSISDLAKSLNKNISYTPITVPGITCMEKALPLKLSITTLYSKPNSTKINSSLKYIKLNNTDSSLRGDNWQTTLNISINPCLPELLSVIDGELQKNDIKTYLLVNPNLYGTIN